MTLIFKPVRSSIADKDGLKLFHPRLIKMQTIDLPTIAEGIAEVSSLSLGDVHSVITNLMKSMRTHLLNSNSVKLDGFGTFTIIAHSHDKGVEKEEDVDGSQITQLMIRFMPEYTRSSFAGKNTKFYDGVTFRSLADMEELLKKNGVTDSEEVIDDTDKDVDPDKDPEKGDTEGDGGDGSGL